MKKIITVLVLTLSALFSFAQTADKMKKHSGETLDVKVIKVNEETISYKYPGEDAEQTIGKFAVASITYGSSGRKEEITEKIEISDKGDWEKVQIITNTSQVVGLKKGEEVRGKTGLINFQTGNTGDKKAEKKLKMAAAEIGCPFILLTADKVTAGANANQMGGSQAIKKGVTYNYK